MTEYTGRERFWIRCPVCGAKTRLQLLWETELRAFPLFCPKCKSETLIDAKNYMIQVQVERKGDLMCDPVQYKLTKYYAPPHGRSGSPIGTRERARR